MSGYKQLLQASLVAVMVSSVGAFTKPSQPAATPGAHGSRFTLTATLSGPGTSPSNDHVCIGTEYGWSVSASGGTAPYTYDWEVGGSYLGTHSSSMSYTFYSGGWYHVVVDVYDATTARYSDGVWVFAETC